MKVKLTCNDAYYAMVREDITVTATSLDEAWDKAKTRFARKHKTKKAYIDITAVQWIER